MTKFVRQLSNNKSSGPDESHIHYPAGWYFREKYFPLGLLLGDTSLRSLQFYCSFSIQRLTPSPLTGISSNKVTKESIEEFDSLFSPSPRFKIIKREKSFKFVREREKVENKENDLSDLKNHGL